MYDWRHLNPTRRAELLADRKALKQPWHSPPHIGGSGAFHITAACYEHRPHIDSSQERIAQFTDALLGTAGLANSELLAWCVLPNHYHLLCVTEDLRRLLSEIGKLHGRTSFEWNSAENARGRKIWCGSADRAIRSEAHFWATVNYIHHNPVRHGYVTHWQEWPHSSASHFMEQMGREECARIWRSFPILDYGKGWDEFDDDPARGEFWQAKA